MAHQKKLWVSLVLFVFVVVGVGRHLHVYGDDLSSSYLGCRVLAAGHAQHLYSHSSTNFTDVDDPLWTQIAMSSGFSKEDYLHRYVQTPLWAYGLEPLCQHMSYRPFCHLFLVLIMLCTAGTIWLVARYWTTRLFHPGWIALVCVSLYATQPFKYALHLVQTHMIFVFLTVLAIVLADAKKNVWAGLSLALAAIVKLTPGFLVLYWLLARRQKSAWSFVAWCAAFACISYLALGPSLLLAYIHNLSETSRVLLVAFNNQSFAGFLMGRRHPAEELFTWRIYPLPALIKAISFLLVLATSVIGGLLDRNATQGSPSSPPYGAVFAVLGATMFTPIAWTHYYVLLVIPLMLLLDRANLRRGMVWVALALLIWLLNIYPISFEAVLMVYKQHSIARSQFYAGAIALAALAGLRWASIGRAGRSAQEHDQIAL